MQGRHRVARDERFADEHDVGAAAAHAQPAKPAPMTRMSVSTVEAMSVMGSGAISHS